MFRSSAIAFVTAAVASLGAIETANAQSTIRIEPRPFYGAVVTLEEGVRVIRPLPPDRYVIINPDQKTPLSISINDTTVHERRIVRHYHSDAGGPAIYGGASRLGVGQGARYSARHWHRSH